MHERYLPPQSDSELFALFQIHSLSYRYPDGQAALEGIDLTVFEGDRIALVGHNGAGKTTLVKHLNGLYRPREGELLYKGTALLGENLDRARMETGVLFQDPDDQLFCNTIYEDLAFGPFNQGLDEAEVDRRVRESARNVGIDHLLFKAPHNLSYGQKKRAAFAAVMAMHPDVLILDEPTANLDPRQEKLFQELIQAYPGTIIVISHDLPFLYGICERAVVMEKGRIHHDYTMKDLLSQRAYLREHGLDFTFRFSCCSDSGIHSHEHPHEHPHRHPHIYPRAHGDGHRGGDGQPDGQSRAGSDGTGRTTRSPGSHDPRKSNGGGNDTPLIHLLDYSYRYADGTWGIRDVHLHVNEGETLAIVGENGAGKSTLARCLLGIARGTGSFEFGGVAVDSGNRKELWRQVGMVFQDPADQLFCPTCREEAAFGMKQLGLPHSEIDDRVTEALRTVGLSGYENRVTHHLSAGERKRLAIGAVLAMDPRVLILDEPTANLDPASEELVMEILRNLKVTKLLISHDMPLVLALCERTIVMHQARIIRDYLSRDFQRDHLLVSINGLDYTFKNAHCREIMELQESYPPNLPTDFQA